MEADTAGLIDQLEAERAQAAVFVQDNRGDARALRDRFASTDTAVIRVDAPAAMVIHGSMNALGAKCICANVPKRTWRW